MAAVLPPDVALILTIDEALNVENLVVDTTEVVVTNATTPILLSFDPIKGDKGDTGSQGPPGPAVPGPPGPSAVSADANNKAILGSDSFILVPGTASATAATLHSQVVSGDDPQLTNARSPTAHHSTHEHGGSDPVTITYNDLSGIPASFNPSAHAATHKSGGSDVIGLDTLGAPTDITALNVSTTAHGLTPKAPNDATKVLRGDGAFGTLAYSALGSIPSSFSPSAHAATHESGGSDAVPLDALGAPSDITTLNASTSAHGLLRKLDGNTAHFLAGDGSWTTPAGGGDMLKSVYDINNDGIVDKAAVLSTPGAAHQFWKNGNTWAAVDWTDLTSIPAPGFLNKTTAYTLTAADSGKYVICSGGSWTLTLPAPAVGLNYRLRNDMSISGTTGTITLQPTGGTIDGLSSIALLPQQDCTLITDGTNWRTLGLHRELVLGTQDIASATASAFVLLPLGYRYYELAWENVVGSTDNTQLTMNFSVDGGSTWKTDASYGTDVVFTATTTVSNNYLVAAFGYLAPGTTFSAVGGTVAAHCYSKLWPGNGTRLPHWKMEGWGYNSASAIVNGYLGGGHYSGGSIIVNAIRYQMASGNILSSQLTVKGVV